MDGIPMGGEVATLGWSGVEGVLIAAVQREPVMGRQRAVIPD